MGKKRLGSRAFGVPVALVLVAAAACGGSKATTPAQTGGAWTFVPPGSDAASGGSVSAGAGGVAGASGGSGGVAGTGGVGGVGGVGGATVRVPKPYACNGEVPNQPLITHFDGFMKDRWVSPGNLDGGVYIYPEPLTVEDGQFLRFSDKVTTYAGIGVWFSGCIKASSFKGVRFTVSGSLPPGKAVRMYAISNRNRDIDEDNGVGACLPADPDDIWGTCRPPGLILPVTPEPTTQAVPWTAFKDGQPSLTTDGSDMLALQWSFDWSDGIDPYDAQLTIDDLEFYQDEPEPVGAGGEGGATSTPSDGGMGGS
jgi:hypothetical protein